MTCTDRSSFEWCVADSYSVIFHYSSFMLLFITVLFLTALILTGAPLAGALILGRDLTQHLMLPHMTQAVEQASFSWPAWIGMAMFILVLCVIYLLILMRAGKRVGNIVPVVRKPFPWWGMAGGVLLLTSWFLAWNRFEWFAAWQPFTFTPLWCGYIVVVNALTQMRKGSCLLINRPRYMVSLFLLSAIFWWCFEYLNTYICNWHYVGTETLTPGQIIFHSSLAYATVLPAVLCTMEWLGTFPRITYTSRGLVPVRTAQPATWALVSVVCGSVLLMLVTMQPQYLFPLVWITPLFIMLGLQCLLTGTHSFRGLASGNWQTVILSALAALFCGFFWELWNYRSFAHWEYDIPYVQAFHLFKMPVLGYAGYFPFGLSCLAVAGLLPGGREVIEKHVLSGTTAHT